MFKAVKILLFLLAVQSLNLFAQDPQFSQYYANPLYLSPSNAGATDGSRVVANFRDQWPQIPGAFITYSLSLDHYIRSLKSGIGLFFMRDQAGTGKLSTTNIGFQYSYNIRLNPKWFVRPGIHFLYAQRSVDVNRQTFVDQISIHGTNPVTTEFFPVQKADYFDCSASAMVYSRKQWIGITIDHLLRTNQSFLGSKGPLPVKYSFYGGKKIDLNHKMGKFNEESLTISMLFKMQKEYKMVDLGTYWYKAPFVLGLWYRGLPIGTVSGTNYRNHDALIFLAGYKSLTFSVCYSYDFTVSRLVSSTGGAHEISFIFLFNQGPNLKTKKKRNIVSCPKF